MLRVATLNPHRLVTQKHRDNVFQFMRTLAPAAADVVLWSEAGSGREGEARRVPRKEWNMGARYESVWSPEEARWGVGISALKSTVTLLDTIYSDDEGRALVVKANTTIPRSLGGGKCRKERSKDGPFSRGADPADKWRGNGPRALAKFPDV